MQYYRQSPSVSGKYQNLSYSLSATFTGLKDVDFSEFVKTENFSRVNRDLRVKLLESGSEPYLDQNKANSVFFNSTLRLNKRNSLRLNALHLFDQDGGGQEYAEISFRHFKSVRQQECVSLEYDHIFNNKFELSARTQYRYDKELNDWIYQDTIDGGVISSVFSWNIDGSQSLTNECFLKINAFEQKNYTIIGSGIRQDKLAEIYYEEAGFDHLQKFLRPRNSFVFFQSQQYLFRKRMYANVGIRKDFHSIYSAPVTIRGGINYKPSRQLTLKYFYSEAFKAPTLFDLEINDDLQPESNYTHEISMILKASAIWSIQMTTYYSHSHNLIVTVKDPSKAESEDIFTSVNEGIQNYYGNETCINFTTHNLSAKFSFSYTESDNMLKISPLKGNLSVSYAFKQKHHISVLAHYASQNKTDYLTESYETAYTFIKPFFTSDCIWYFTDFIPSDIFKAKLSISIQNIGNRINYYPNFRGNDPASFKEQERSFWLKIAVII